MKHRESPALIFTVCPSSWVAISLKSLLQQFEDKGRGGAINKGNGAMAVFYCTLQANSILTFWAIGENWCLWESRLLLEMFPEHSHWRYLLFTGMIYHSSSKAELRQKEIQLAQCPTEEGTYLGVFKRMLSLYTERQVPLRAYFLWTVNSFHQV